MEFLLVHHRRDLQALAAVPANLRLAQFDLRLRSDRPDTGVAEIHIFTGRRGEDDENLRKNLPHERR